MPSDQSVYLLLLLNHGCHINFQSNQDRKECKDCSASVGSWFGIIAVLLVIALTIVTATTPKYVEKTSNFWKSITILAEEAILCLFGIAFVTVAFFQIRKLKFSIATRQSHVEEFLLYTAFFFSANFTISTMILSADFEDENRTFNKKVRISKSAFTMLQYYKARKQSISRNLGDIS